MTVGEGVVVVVVVVVVVGTGSQSYCTSRYFGTFLQGSSPNAIGDAVN